GPSPVVVPRSSMAPGRVVVQPARASRVAEKARQARFIVCLQSKRATRAREHHNPCPRERSKGERSRGSAVRPPRRPSGTPSLDGGRGKARRSSRRPASTNCSQQMVSLAGGGGGGPP